MILPIALVVPIFFSSSSRSLSLMWNSRSSSATEKGISKSPGLFSSIQALILGSLHASSQLGDSDARKRTHHLFFFLM